MHKRFNSPIAFTQSFEAVDKDKGIIKGVVICEEGEAKGHGVMLNKKFISDVVKKGKEFGDVGVKSRFGHPNMCSDALGTYLGRYKNFREQHGEKYRAVADLYIDDSAKITPNGNLSEYILKLADSAPDHFGNSIVFEPGKPEIKKTKHEDGTEIETHYAVIKELLQSDLVDSPAATPGLFSQLDSSELAYQVTEFLDSNPKIFDLIHEKPDMITDFMSKYNQYVELKKDKPKQFNMNLEDLTKAFTDLKDQIIEGVKSSFTKKEGEPANIEVKLMDEQAIQDTITELQAGYAENETLKASVSEKDTQINDLRAELSTAKDSIERMKVGKTEVEATDDPPIDEEKNLTPRQKAYKDAAEEVKKANQS